MGHGASKSVESIPLSYLIPIYAAEGLLSVAHSELFIEMRKAKANPDNVDWKEVTRLRIEVFNLTKQYTSAIMNLERYMQNG